MNPYAALFATTAAQYGLPVWLLDALARRESSYRADTLTWENRVQEYSVGLFGLLQSTARSLGFRGTVAELQQPAVNLDLAAQLARQIIESLGAGWSLADFYSAWNSGRAQLWETSTEVAAHVRLFLADVAAVVGVTLPAGAAIPAMLAYLATVLPPIELSSETETAGAGVLGLGALAWLGWSLYKKVSHPGRH